MRALEGERDRAKTRWSAWPAFGWHLKRGTLGFLLIAGVFAAGQSLYAAGPQRMPTHTSRKYWIGRSISQAEKEFGTPTFSEQLLETGGMLIIYSSKENPVQFVFETNADGRIIKAARIE